MKNNLKEKIKLAKEMPGIAHLPSFGLILYSGKEVICKKCGGHWAPIVDGEHLGNWCNKEEVSDELLGKK